MIGIVVVSHSPALARAAVELALEMGGSEPPPLRIAAGASGGATGTDAVAIAAAIDDVASDEGVLVLMDLGSAVLSAGLALEFVHTDAPVVLSPAPFVEGLIAAVVGASSGASLSAVAADSARGLEAKRSQLGGDTEPASPAAAAQPRGEDAGTASFEAVVRNPTGLHARPAATFVKTAARYDADVTVTDLDTGKGPVSAASLISLISLGVTKGTNIRVTAVGPQASEVAQALEALVADGFGER